MLILAYCECRNLGSAEVGLERDFARDRMSCSRLFLVYLASWRGVDLGGFSFRCMRIHGVYQGEKVRKARRLLEICESKKKVQKS